MPYLKTATLEVLADMLVKASSIIDKLDPTNPMYDSEFSEMKTLVKYVRSELIKHSGK